MIEFRVWNGCSIDLAAYNDLLNLVYRDRALPYEVFRWKHCQNPLGKSVITLAFLGGKLVGARALQPTMCGNLIIFQPCDTVTHPDFQRRGIFGRLTRLALDQIKPNKNIVLNFPNSKSLPAYLKCGWKFHERLTPKIGLNPFASIRTLPKLSKSEAEDLFSQAENEGLGAYFCWRFCHKPFGDYRFFKKGISSLLVLNKKNMSYEVNFSTNDEPDAQPIVPFLCFSYYYNVRNNWLETLVARTLGKGTNIAAQQPLDSTALFDEKYINVSGLMDTF